MDRDREKIFSLAIVKKNVFNKKKQDYKNGYKLFALIYSIIELVS